MSDRSKGKTANQPPVSAHPAFPVIVALWFAALCGIGSMVLPLEMFERFSVASGLADAYAAAQPPLGATARIAVAVIAALIGGAAGVFVAGRVRAANAPRTASRRAAALQPSQTRFSAKRPISAHEELGEGGLDADAGEDVAREAPVRRRALAVTDDSAPSDFLSFAPLPGRSANEADAPLDLVAFEEPEVVEAPSIEEPAPEEIVPQPAFARAPEEFGSSVLSTAASRPFDGPADFAAPVAQPLPLGRGGEPDTAPAEALESAPAAVPVSERTLAELGMVELVERFALALQRHQPLAETPAADASVDESLPEEPAISAAESGLSSEPLAEAEPVAPEPAEAPAPAALPDALRPFGFEETDDETEGLPDLDIAATLSQSRGPFSAPFAAALDDVFDDDTVEEEVAEESYTSLLAMKSPLGQREPVRIEDADDADVEPEPVVVFPGQAVRRAAPVAEVPARPFDAPLQRAENSAGAVRHPSADPGATERALRDALEKLQRMSGAA